jgi:LysR family transcriptional regulator, cys regulon transcriptional activator
MELRQLRSLTALVDADFSVSRAAERLNLVQPAVSQHLKQLEAELGLPLFCRSGRRLTGLTHTGEQVVRHARASLASTSSILALARDQRGEHAGLLRIGTTHTQARYLLPPAVRRFRAAFPRVELEIHQGTPLELAEMAVQDRVDLAICTEVIGEHPALAATPCYRWNRCLIAPLGHPVLDARPLTLELIASQPLVTYVSGFTGRGRLNGAFARHGLTPRVVLAAADSDVIKTYVREGLGVGIIAALAWQEGDATALGMRDLAHLFPWELARVAHLRERYLRRFEQEFVEMVQEEAGGLARLQRSGPD